MERFDLIESSLPIFPFSQAIWNIEMVGGGRLEDEKWSYKPAKGTGMSKDWI